MRKRGRCVLAGITVALAMFVSSCGDSGSSSAGSQSTGSQATAAPTTTARKLTATVAGCEKNGVTDPADLSATRQVARCAANTPAPKPLATRAKLTIASAFRLEFNSPILLADSLGEFNKENIEVKFVSLSFADSVPQLANGQVDAAVGDVGLALFNAGYNNVPVKIVMGNYFPPDAGNYSVPQTGLWCRKDSFSNPQNPTAVLKEIEKMRWASSVGKGSSAIYYSSAELKKRIPDFDISKVQFQQVPSADTMTALRNKAVDCGILLDPLWTQAKDDPAYFMAATQTPGEPLGQYAFGKNLLIDKPDVGEAFVRAVVRTVNTYFNGDYHSNPQVMAEIAKQTNQDVSKLTALPPLTMDWEFRAGTTDRVQRLFIDLAVITNFTTPVPEDKLVDRSFYLKAVGAQ
jgi:NitT/TauT family transport system substrate-binding protein